MSSDKRISELTLVAANASGDMFPMVQGSTTFKTTLAKISTFLQGYLTASTSAKGVVELATNAETQTGSDTTRAVTPAGLASVVASESLAGLAEIATQGEADAGTDDAKIITPLKLENFDKWATKENILDTANTASGTNSVTLNTTSGVCTFTEIVVKNSLANFTLNNNNITSNSVLDFEIKYAGSGAPVVMYYQTTANQVTFHIANLQLTGHNADTDSDIVIWFKIVG